MKGFLVGDDIVIGIFFLLHVCLQCRAKVKGMSIVPQIRKAKKLPYSPAQMFDLVADVEKYPQFLPWCAAAQLIRRDEKEIIGKLTVEKGGIRKSFTTSNRYDYPHWMDIKLVEGPFRHLSGRWDFEASPEGQGCTVHYRMQFEVMFLLAPILGGLMEYMANSMVDAFARRAHEIYGNGHHPH